MSAVDVVIVALYAAGGILPAWGIYSAYGHAKETKDGLDRLIEGLREAHGRWNLALDPLPVDDATRAQAEADLDAAYAQFGVARQNSTEFDLSRFTAQRVVWSDWVESLRGDAFFVGTGVGLATIASILSVVTGG